MRLEKIEVIGDMANIITKLQRRSMKLLLRPGEFVETGKIPEGFNAEEWRQDFKWIAERKISYVKPIPTTIENNSGDCEDFAAVMLNWMLIEGYEDVSYDFYWRTGQALPTHVTASGVKDGEKVLYNNGDIWLMGPEKFADEVGYERVWSREVNDG